MLQWNIGIGINLMIFILLFVENCLLYMNIQNSLETVLIQRILISFKAILEKNNLRVNLKIICILKGLYFFNNTFKNFSSVVKCFLGFFCLKLKILQLHRLCFLGKLYHSCGCFMLFFVTSIAFNLESMCFSFQV